MTASAGLRCAAHSSRRAGGHGGKGGNQAVAAARLGASTSFVGAVGGDAFGEEALAALSLEGVDVSEALILPAEATGVALILVDADGENSIAVAGGNRVIQKLERGSGVALRER